MTLPEPIGEELRILYGTLCDSIRQEARARKLLQLANDGHIAEADVALTGERESGLTSALAMYLRLTGFSAQVESYVIGGGLQRRPDLRVWPPATKRFLYLEVKTYGWGDAEPSYYYSTVHGQVEADMQKLLHLPTPNGMLVVGLSKAKEVGLRTSLENAYGEMSNTIAAKYPTYETIGHGPAIDLQEMDSRTSYAMVGMWVRP